MPQRKEWARAYARQASSDWDLWLHLNGDASTPRCQALHFLQMATEKIAKAYRFRDTETKQDDLLTRHVGFQKFIRVFLSSPRVTQEFDDRTAQLKNLRAQCNQLAGEVEKLAPAVDRTGRPQNAEYPWCDGDDLTVPRDYEFPNLSFLEAGGGRAFLRWVQVAIREF